jgi:hypothetical protein
MQKRYLFTPGPTPVPPEVLAATAEPMVHHRGLDFREVYERTLARLQEVYRTRGQVLLFAASGSGAMDSAVANLVRPGERVAVVIAGAFGERWAKICVHYGLDVQRIDYEWGEVPDPVEIGGAVAASGVETVFCTQSETSTGVIADVQAIKAAVGDARLVGRGLRSVRCRSTRRLGSTSPSRLPEGTDVPAGLAMTSVADHLGCTPDATILFRLAGDPRRAQRSLTRRSHRPCP